MSLSAMSSMPAMSTAHPPARLRPAVAAVLTLAALLSACATVPGGGVEASASPAAAPGAAASAPAGKPAAVAQAGNGSARPATAPGAPAAAPAPGQPPAFAVLTKDAKKIDGLLGVWQKDEKFWIELSEQDFGVPLFLSPKIASGIGEGSVLGGLMASRWGVYGGPQLVEFRRIHNQVQLIARNTDFIARPGTPEARAVSAGFSPSLLASAPVASLAHPERRTVLVEANALFQGDLLGLGMALQQKYRQGYALDGRNTAITTVRGKRDEVVLEVLSHYATATIAVPQPGTPAGAPLPTTPLTLPDARSLFVRVNYSLTRLPDQPMAARAADGRIGHFVATTSDFSDDLLRSPRLRHITRWRLEKKDPAAALSEPVKPITYWIDRNVPLKYRDAMRAGILEWNKAFEAVGFKNAIVVRQQLDEANFDTLDTGTASVRWMVNASPSFGAIGPSHVDPRSGEILDADIAFESLSSRALRNIRSQLLTRTAADWLPLLQAADARREAAAREPASAHAHAAGEACQHADLAAEELGYALDLLQLRDGLDPAGPEAQAFVMAYMKDVTMHEVGHTLGLRHNFRASRVYGERQIADPEFGKSHALTGSVMEYAPINLARPGEREAAPFQTTLGPYDYWAIEYAYRPIAPAQEAAELARIAARSAEPELAYGTDEDNYLGIDPEALHFDLGDDPVAYAAKRLEIVRDLLARLEQRSLASERDYGVLRRVVSYALRDVGRSAGVLARQIGGLRTLRDAPGTGRDPLQPVPAERQRAALDLLARGVFAADGLSLSPALQRRLAPDFLERRDALEEGAGSVGTDFVPQQVLIELQRALLAQLMSDGLAQRLLDAESKVSAPGQSLRLGELYGRLDREIWAELSGKGDIVAARRELQREHVNRLAGLLLNPRGLTRADARSFVRVQAQELLARLQAAGKRTGLSSEARAHLQDSADSLREALQAKLLRTGA
ncbi:zinc-dependent metalloprotease [Sphaerotilus microaerophilus]|uniref:Zinc-dependent metalloprotease n=1 Tax=Sphaerotilus microaerophilus TaxID=2914710 RepID=A0ABM7YR43_9BURK|nr:zinc-dependent metalloprotease [Sphaerotilus sp. FB-5]BDI07027.1 hypothetical protein CATMQ487_39970 [Sphaerotilus sp. FB-5]